MSSDRTIVDAIKVAQDLLRQNLPPTHNLTDAATVMRFRELVRSQAIRSALDRSSDTLPDGPTPSQGVADFGIGSTINSTGYMSAVDRNR